MPDADRGITTQDTMIKVLLYLSLLFTSDIAAGGGMLSVDDIQPAQQLYSSDQVDDSNNLDADDPEASAFHKNVGTFCRTEV